MSYTPRIIVDYADLDDLFNSIPDELSYSDAALKFVHEEYADKYAGIHNLKGIKIMILQPELTDFNKEVRDWLFTHDIEYTEII